jgi:DNA-binding response OmpR family regulator
MATPTESSSFWSRLVGAITGRKPISFAAAAADDVDAAGPRAAGRSAPSESVRIVFPSTPRLLLIDGSASQRSSVRDALTRQGCSVEVVTTVLGAMPKLAHGAVDVVLLDASVLGAGGLDEIVGLEREARAQDVPLMLLVDASNPAIAAQFVARGGNDFVLLPSHPALLAARVRAAFEVHRLRHGEAQRARRLESLIRAAAEVEGGRYRAGSLQTSTADDVLAPVLRVFDMLASRHAPAEPPKSTPWDGASVVIDTKQIEDLRAKVAAARAQQGRVEEP